MTPKEDTLKSIEKSLLTNKVISKPEIRLMLDLAEPRKDLAGSLWDDLDRKYYLDRIFTRDELRWLLDEVNQGDFSDQEKTPVLGGHAISPFSYPSYQWNGYSWINSTQPSVAPQAVAPASRTQAYGSPFVCNVCNKDIDGQVDHSSCCLDLDRNNP